MRKTSIAVLLLAACLALFACSAAAKRNFSALSLEPASVKINAFFDGASLKVKGLAPAQDQVVVRLASSPHDAVFRVKDHRWGILWMNQGTVSFHDVPAVYLCLASNVPPDALNLGLKFLRSRARIQAGSGDPDKLFQEFIKIKEGEGLYSISKLGVNLGDPYNGQRPFECSFSLPARMPPGSYQVQPFLKGPNGEVIAGSASELKIEEVGFPALLSALAFNHGLLYGVLAALVALGGGLLTSLLFKGGGSSH
jgi:hypothetical protein